MFESKSPKFMFADDWAPVKQVSFDQETTAFKPQGISRRLSAMERVRFFPSAKAGYSGERLISLPMFLIFLAHSL
jgi:hypothetical protein